MEKEFGQSDESWTIRISVKTFTDMKIGLPIG